MNKEAVSFGIFWTIVQFSVFFLLYIIQQSLGNNSVFILGLV